MVWRSFVGYFGTKAAGRAMVGGGLGDKSTEGKELECILEEWMIACGDEEEEEEDDDDEK